MKVLLSTSVTGQDAITGIIAGELAGKILNCSVINSAVICTASDKNNTENSSRWAIAGGIVGKVSGGSVQDCSIAGVSFSASSKKHDRGWSTSWNEAAYVYAGGVAGEVASGTISGNSIVSIAKMHGNAKYRANTFWPDVAGVFSRVCPGGVVGRQARDGVLYASNSTVSSCSLFEAKFNSYNDTYRVDAHEDRYTNVGIGLTD